MSEEEIMKEIEIIKETQDIMQHNLDIYPPKEDIYRLDTKQLKAVICLLDLYYKRQKEIKTYKKFIEDKTKIGKDIQTFINKGYVEQEYISKDKIREIINSSLPDFAIQKIIELLGE